MLHALWLPEISNRQGQVRVEPVVGSEVVRHRSIVETDVQFSREEGFVVVLDQELVAVGRRLALLRFVVTKGSVCDNDNKEGDCLPVPKVEDSKDSDKQQEVVETEF